MNWSIAGHKKQLELFENALAKNKLAHAYVFAGPEAVGKKLVAKKLAQDLLGMESETADFFHPDFIEVKGEEGIKVEQVRDLTYKLSLKPYQAKNKVAVIDNAHELTMEAANSLLKTLEEPTSYTYIILITSNPNRLPKTILSRCQKITFGPVAFSDYQNLLPANLSPEKQKLIDAIASGKPGLALKIALDENYLEQLEKEDEYFQIFINGQLTDRLILAYDVANLESHEIKNLLDTWTLRLQQGLYTKASLQLAKKISYLSSARNFLEQNVNSKLLLTNLILNTQ